MGCEVFSIAGASNFVTKTIQSTKLGKYGARTLSEIFADSYSELISEKAYENYLRFYPAGTSLNCLIHLK